jgi:2-oxoglutarate/2-oxoacid ferredoxin oxidoreductase subunit alpha
MSNTRKVIEREDVVVRFAGDSGDGMQLTGTLFSDTSAFLGNDLSTFPDYPSEVRAPQGTIGGVSGFQVHFGHRQVNTPGDFADVLVAMNPAALKSNFKWVKSGGTIILDQDSLTDRALHKAGYKTHDPVEEDHLEGYNLIKAPITTLTKKALEDVKLDQKSILQSKNMFALGMVYWLFDRPLKYTEQFFERKFSSRPEIIEANKKVLEAGYHYAETVELLTPTYKISPAEIEKGTYRNIDGNTATAWGFIAAAEKSGLELFCGSYPITPASEILHELAMRRDLGVKTFQAEDEIAGICTALGASFAGSLAVTVTSGPGLALKSEAIGLAVMTELPIVIVDVQRGGPSTGLPTKPEQSDLMQALYGRNGESPVVVLAASTPSNCFFYAFKAAKIALEHMLPVILLTDGYLANGSEPWKIPAMADYPHITPPIVPKGEKAWMPYARDPEKLARTWAVPGTPDFEHRIGGLEKDELQGCVSHDPINHEKMVYLREEKVNRVINDVPEQKIQGDMSGDILLTGWGGTYGHLKTALDELRKEGVQIGLAHFNYIKPLPSNVEDLFKKFNRILVCELNRGQFMDYLRMNHPEFNYLKYNKVQGQPFTSIEIKEHVHKLLKR